MAFEWESDVRKTDYVQYFKILSVYSNQKKPTTRSAH